MFTVKEFPRVGLSEISQTHNEKFSFCQQDGTTLIECCVPVKCRDFFQDLWMHRNYGSVVDIYGFEYDDNKNPKVDFDRFRMLMYFTNTAHLETFRENYGKLLKELEPLGWEQFEIFDTDKALVKYIRGDKRWMATPYTISIITLLLRIATYKLKGEKLLDDLKVQSQDHGYLKCNLSYDSGKNVAQALRAWFKAPALITEFKGVPIYTIHNYGGVMNMFAFVNPGGREIRRAQQKLKESIAHEMSKL